MLSYELCKRLKDAGFPHDWEEFSNHDEELLVIDWGIYNNAYSPSLSELIEACGEKFMSLSYYPWTAVGDRERVIVCTSKTPEEAVASLWLKLHQESIDKKCNCGNSSTGCYCSRHGTGMNS